MTPGLSDFTTLKVFFFSSLTRDQVGTTVVKIEDAKIIPYAPLPATKAWPSLPQITWHPDSAHSDCSPLEMNCYIMPAQNTHAKHTQPHTKSHLSATSREGEVLGPQPTAPSPPAASFPSEINHTEGWGAHKSLEQTRKSNSTIYLARASSLLTRREDPATNRPCPGRYGLPQGGDLRPPRVPALSCWPTRDLSFSQPRRPPQTW